MRLLALGRGECQSIYWGMGRLSRGLVDWAAPLRRVAAILGGRTVNGRPVARHAYRLGAAPAPDGTRYIVTLIDEVPGVRMVFEADTFDVAFARALIIGEDMADLAGHLGEGVLISVEERAHLPKRF